MSRLQSILEYRFQICGKCAKLKRDSDRTVYKKSVVDEVRFVDRDKLVIKQNKDCEMREAGVKTRKRRTSRASFSTEPCVYENCVETVSVASFMAPLWKRTTPLCACGPRVARGAPVCQYVVNLFAVSPKQALDGWMDGLKDGWMDG
ncbi:hypothetical protein L596_004916 [Steinernema carpocapsae]|uniref:Uncharacterized protein n=1 Tax=Steinernema carpocapsae TaxID=34508 RepID=A0A4U8UXF0_STECR|nr:hypothetical protein L596_004916 [Steinernema carpocapsae]